MLKYYIDQSTFDISFSEDNEDETVSINKIIGEDERTKVSSTKVLPYSAIAYIEIDFPDGETLIGTAWMIGDNAAVTAGHCVYDPDHGGWADRIRVWPGKHGYGFWNNPYGNADSTRLVTSQIWADTGDGEYDWGLIELDEDIGADSGVLTFSYASDSLLSSSTINISGYPGDHRYYQYEMSGVISYYTDNNLFYTIDTYGGQSGSPIMINNIAYGIHTGGSEIIGINWGVRITSNMYTIFHTFISECN